MQRIALKCGRFYRTIPRSVNSSVNNYNKSVPLLQYSSNTPSIGSQTLSNNRDDRVSERTVLKRNAIQSTESKDCNQIECIKYFADEDILQMQFSDGQALNFNTFWLRDSCHCPQCVHPLTRTKLFDFTDISADLFVDRVDCSGDVVVVQWRSAVTEEHTSEYSISWLRLFNDIFDSNPNPKGVIHSKVVVNSPNDGLYASPQPLPQRVLWDATQVDKQKMTINFNHFMNSDESLRQYLQIFSRFGVVFLEDVPIEKNKVLNVVQRMSYKKSTYGTTFDVILKPQTNGQIAYKGSVVQPHVDQPYRERSPGIQLIHYLDKNSLDGISTLVDGFKCAETLRHSNPEHFRCLTENAVTFSFCDNERGLWFRQKRPIIELNCDQTIKEIHYSHQTMRPPLLPSPLLGKFYDSYRKLTQLIRDDSSVYRYSIRPGDLVMFDNRRVLHGREEFDHLTKRRHLEVCHMDLDEVMALYERLTA